jgi:coenzyme F420-reducing hydrogenase gamma subunit
VTQAGCGAVTQAGCGALCPSYNRECFGCFGPKEQPNLASLSTDYLNHGVERGHLIRLLRNFNAYALNFREASNALEGRTTGEP